VSIIRGIRRLASESGKTPSEVVVELVNIQLDYDTCFRREVQKGIDSLDRELFIDDEDIGSRLDHILKSS
jgi:hypothetical protein